MSLLEENNKAIRHALAQRLKNQVRKIPEIVFFEDDTMDYVVKIEKLFDSLNNEDKKD